MAQSTLTIIVTIVTLILFAIPSLPIELTTLLSAMSLVCFGVITFQEAVSGFASTAVFVVAGMMVMGYCCRKSGLITLLSKRLHRFAGYSERTFIVIMFIFVSAISAVINVTAVVALMMPLLDNIDELTDGRISRKQTYFPMGAATVLGSGLSTISTGSMLTANELLANAGYERMGLFTPMVTGLPALVMAILLYLTFGHRFQRWCFDFEEIPAARTQAELATGGEQGMDRRSMVISGVVLIGVMACIFAGIQSGLCAIVGVAVLILSGCIDAEEAWQSISWSTIIIIGASIGLSLGIDKSGAGPIMANALLRLAGPLSGTTFGLGLVIFVIASLLSNLLADTGTVAIMMPIVFSLATTQGMEVLPLALACMAGTKIALATPICTANMTMVRVVGYRFKDYVLVGGLINVICMLGVLFALVVFF